MASAAGPFPIFYTPDVHNFYIKQKQEFHFNQKSDNEFLMFLLDTAVRVISIGEFLSCLFNLLIAINSIVNHMLYPLYIYIANQYI